MAFRRYGGLAFASSNNYVRSNISNTALNATFLTIGLLNTKILCESHMDMSGNSLLHVDSIYFQNGTSLGGSLGNYALTTASNLFSSINTFASGITCPHIFSATVGGGISNSVPIVPSSSFPYDANTGTTIPGSIGYTLSITNTHSNAFPISSSSSSSSSSSIGAGVWLVCYNVTMTAASSLLPAFISCRISTTNTTNTNTTNTNTTNIIAESILTGATTYLNNSSTYTTSITCAMSTIVCLTTNNQQVFLDVTNNSPAGQTVINKITICSFTRIA